MSAAALMWPPPLTATQTDNTLQSLLPSLLLHICPYTCRLKAVNHLYVYIYSMKAPPPPLHQPVGPKTLPTLRLYNNLLHMIRSAAGKHRL